MPGKTKIEQIMTKGVFSVDIDDTIHKADEIIKNEGVRHVPVTEEGKFIGLITERTLMEYSLKQL
jgi:predicted transcriptional regulator